MKPLLRVTVLSLALLAAALAAAQGIRSPLLPLDLPGQWQPKPEWLAGVEAPQGEVYYEAGSATVLHLRPGDASWTQADLTAIVAQLREVEQSKTSYPSVARVLASAFFPLPTGYRERSMRTNPGRRGYPRVWETDAQPGHAQWFYASQLTTGMSAQRVGKNTYRSEDINDLRLLTGERRAAGNGEAIVFEVETTAPASAEAAARFEIPAANGTRIRYGWVLYAPKGFTEAAGMISIGYATPSGSPITPQAILATLVERNR